MEREREEIATKQVTAQESFGDGRHETLWRRMGAHLDAARDVVRFAVWAPGARAVSVVGDFNGWDPAANPLKLRDRRSGVWEGESPAAREGSLYKYRITPRNGDAFLKSDPFAFATERPPATASVVFSSAYEWGDSGWMQRRASEDPLRRSFSIYECHIGSWQRGLSYRELAPRLADHVADLGFTHVEFLPVAEHPFRGSWGYQVSAYYAPSARFGSPDDFRFLVDHLHQRGIGVIVDWVPAHFPKDDFALARFDGTPLYEHADPARAEHPDWGTLSFDFAKAEVRNFLIANALWWLEEFHVDGLRVDAVASMIYLDYSRKPGQWVPNVHGGREDLEAVDFLKELNTIVYARNPSVLMIAEESTAWPGVSRPVHLGGLGFGCKWNLGWMNDTLKYFRRGVEARGANHERLSFGIVYYWHENFVLPLSHDEVVHEKRSLLAKMPEPRMDNLRALLGWMWAHPGRPLLFMGGELAQMREWSHDRSLDWDLLDIPAHRGIKQLVADLNRVRHSYPALWEGDFEEFGFEWLDVDQRYQAVLAFARHARDRRQTVVCIANLSADPVDGYGLEPSVPGPWRVILDTQDSRYSDGSGSTGAGGSGDAKGSMVDLSALDLLPFSVLLLVPAGTEDLVSVD